MLAILTTSGSSAAVTQTACGRSARAMRRVTIACSSRSLVERSSCSPRWSSTAGSALRRVEPASASVAARRPSRRTSSSGLAATNAASPRPAQKRWQAGKRLAQDAEHRGGVVGDRRVDLDLAGQHDLLEARRRGCARRRARRPPRSARAASRETTRYAAGRVGVQQRQRGAERAARPTRRSSRPMRSSATSSGAASAQSGQPHVLAAPRERDLGHVQRRGGEARPSAARRRRRARTRSRRRRPARRPRGPSGGSQTACGGQARASARPRR